MDGWIVNLYLFMMIFDNICVYIYIYPRVCACGDIPFIYITGGFDPFTKWDAPPSWENQFTWEVVNNLLN